MGNEELTSTAVVSVVQLPIIEEQLYLVQNQIKKEVECALSLVCTADTIQTVKQTRAELNKQFEELEEVRKQVKRAVMAPYDRFEAVYKECVSNEFKHADAALKQKVDSVESEMKQKCEANLRMYFDECCVAYNIDFIKYEDAHIKVDMASAKAKTPKKLMEQIRCFVESVAEQVAMISSMNNADEIMVEFKQSLNAAAAIAIVEKRNRMIEEEQAAAAARKEIQDQRKQAETRVRAYAPATVELEEKLLTVKFTVTDTLPRLKALKAWLEANNYRYE